MLFLLIVNLTIMKRIEEPQADKLKIKATDLTPVKKNTEESTGSNPQTIFSKLNLLIIPLQIVLGIFVLGVVLGASSQVVSDDFKLDLADKATDCIGKIKGIFGFDAGDA